MAPKRDVSGHEGDGKDKAKWDDVRCEIFLKVCIEEILAGNRPGTHFSKEGWKNLETKFQERTGYSYDRKQLKNKWDSLKREFSSFAKLVEKETGLGWDSEKKTIKASDEWWADKGKEDPEILKWKEGGPRFLELMEQCFKGVVATGLAVLVPYQDAPFNDGGNEVGEDYMGDSGDAVAGGNEGHSDEPQQSGRTDSRKRKRAGKEGKKVGPTERLQRSLDHLVEGLDRMSSSTVSKDKPDDPCSYEKCLAMMDEVPGLMEGSSDYFLLIRILAKKEHRIAFMHLMKNKPYMTIGWLSTFQRRIFAVSGVYVDIFIFVIGSMLLVAMFDMNFNYGTC